MCGGGQGRCDALDAVCLRGDAWVVVHVECAVMIGRMRRAVVCAWLTFVIVRADRRLHATLCRQSERACGGSEGSGGAGSSCEPSQGGFVGHVVGAGFVYPGDCLWFVRVSVVVGRWHARVSGVWWWPRKVRRA